MIAAVLQLLGMLAVVVAGALVAVPLGVALAGVALFLVGLSIEGESS